MRYLAIAVLGFACHSDAMPDSQPTAVRVAPVERGSNAGNTRYSAAIVPATRVDLAFRVGGYIETIAMATGVDGKPRTIQEGDPVHPQMQLAAIRNTEYVQRLAEARAGLAQAGANYGQTQIDLGRSKRLAAREAVAGSELDLAKTKRDSAGAAASGAKARYDQAKTQLADTVLNSPIDGTVLKRNIEVGQLASPGTVAFSVGDITSVKVVFGVPDTVLARLKLGDAKTITTEAFPGEKFEGKITLISASADPRTRVFEVDVTIPNPDGRLKPGSVAALSLEKTDDVGVSMLIPLSAIVRSPLHPDHFTVYVVEEVGDRTIVRARDVELGDYLGRVIPVKQGLNGDEKIVVQGAGLVSDGERVEVIK
jgi:RND family efflux transporter MFP subunit